MADEGGHPMTEDGERSSDCCPPVGAQKPTAENGSEDQAGEKDPSTSSRSGRGRLEPASPITIEGCAEPPPAAATAVLSDEADSLLWHWGLRVNHELKILVCWTCRRGIWPAPERIMSHLESHHSLKGQTVKKQNPNLLSKLQSGLAGFPFSTPGEIRRQPAGRAAIPGIKVSPGFYCPLLTDGGATCQAAYLTSSSLHQHCKTAHAKDKGRLTSKTAQNHPCDCQTIYKGDTRRYFRVKTGLMEDVPENSVNPYSVMMRDLASFTPKVSAIEEFKVEELPSLLRATEWHLFVQNYRKDPKDVVDLIRLPTRLNKSLVGSESDTDRGLAMLLDISEAWVAKVRAHWVTSTPIMRRILDGYPV